MAFEQLSATDKQRLQDFIDSGIKVLQEIQDLKEGLNDTAKQIAEEHGTKKALLMKVLRTAFKSSLDEEKETVDTVETILDAVGRR